ncbi:DUF2489 domain-containing protein [Chryseobacterium arthrosphaerae]|uniref:DUF2489 domain-containing protein n=1 Tax=Chryseobacterium arthrosphaerae TaxID=651561 RepID=UPI0031E1DDAA
MNKFDELKRNRYIKKMHSNAIAMVTGQVPLREGCLKMEYLYDHAHYIQPFEDFEIRIIEDFSSATRFFPLNKQRNLYNQDYLSGLDDSLAVIEEKYRDTVLQKCKDIIEQFQYIRSVIL